MWSSTGTSRTTVFDVNFSLVYTRRGWRVAAPVARLVKGYQTDRKVYYFVSDNASFFLVRMKGTRNEKVGPTPQDFMREPIKHAAILYQGRVPVPNYEKAIEMTKRAITEMAQWLEQNSRGCPVPPCRDKWARPVIRSIDELKDFPVTVPRRSWWEGKIVLSGKAVIYPHEAAAIAMGKCKYVHGLPPFVDTKGRVVDPREGWLVETEPDFCTLIVPVGRDFEVYRSAEPMPVPVEERKPVFVGGPSPAEVMASKMARPDSEEDYEIYDDVYDNMDMFYGWD